MLAVPLATCGVGVNTAVRVRPVPLMGPSDPPTTSTPPVMPSHTKLVPGSSENIKRMLAVSPIFKAEALVKMATVGPVVSTTKCGLLATAMEVMSLSLPASSLSVAPFKLSAFSAMATPSVSV